MPAKPPSTKPVSEDVGPIDPAALLASSKDWMADALDAFLADSHRRVVALAPIALEHLAKAMLAERSPALLVPLVRDSERSLLVLAGHGKAQDRAKLRTIGLTEALGRAEKVLGDCPVSTDDRGQVVAHRNGAVHIGTVAPRSSREVMAIVCQLAEWFLDDLSKERDWFYGDRLEAVDMLLNEKASAIEQRVQQAILAARARHKASFEHITETDDRDEVTAMLEARVPLVEDRPGFLMHAMKVPCPACSSKGQLSGVLDIDAEGEAEYEGDGEYSYHAYWVITFTPEQFHCGVCRLSLHGKEELTAAEFEVPRSLSEEDLDFSPSDLYEPDWDEYYESLRPGDEP